jgi:N-acetylglutamate synthase-like GNAT family acetyltransferase
MVMIPRKLTAFDKQLLINHFKIDIINNDRRLRFGYEAPDDSVDEYIDKSLQNFGVENMWFIVDVDTFDTFGGKRIIATCHVSINRETNTAEMGCTVSPDCRNKKIGQELFNRGITWARMAGAENVFMHCLSENKVIQHIAQKGGMTVVTIDPSEKESTIQVKQNRIEAGFKDYIMDQIAIYDAAIRQQTFFAKKFLKGLVK